MMRLLDPRTLHVVWTVFIVTVGLALVSRAPICSAGAKALAFGAAAAPGAL